jgi:hypothetical protein
MVSGVYPNSVAMYLVDRSIRLLFAHSILQVAAAFTGGRAITPWAAFRRIVGPVPIPARSFSHSLLCQ